MSFSGKIVWITGASSGIGEALVYAFAKEGAKIILSARRESELNRVVKEAGLTTENSLVLPFDLSDTSNIQSLTEKVIQKFQRVDILINNGGNSQRAEAKDTPLEIDRNLMEVNYFSAVAITKSVLPHMLQQKSGHIVAVSSIAGKFGFYLRSGYSAAKHALHGFYESLRLETEKSGIKTLLVCPGKIKTNISLNALDATGGAHNKMDASHENAMSAETCAGIILLAIRENKEEILIGGKELKAVWVKRFFPKLFSKIIRKQSPY